jgi:hypothetical protein
LRVTSRGLGDVYKRQLYAQVATDILREVVSPIETLQPL